MFLNFKRPTVLKRNRVTLNCVRNVYLEELHDSMIVYRVCAVMSIGFPTIRLMPNNRDPRVFIIPPGFRYEYFSFRTSPFPPPTEFLLIANANRPSALTLSPHQHRTYTYLLRLRHGVTGWWSVRNRTSFCDYYTRIAF